jgi:PTH1 family peptidyl-tRNA hydrolase
MKLIIGLGNPDKKYQNTRHNLGQKIIQQYVETLHASLTTKLKLSAKIYECKGESCARPTIIAITTDYMNNSGLSVQKISNFYKISPSNLYVLHDDLDLPVGEYKIQFDRGPAGHNGIKSIIENLGTQQFNRIRIGIGKPQSNVPTEDYVLQPFSKEENDIISNLIPEIFKKIDDLSSTI